MKYLKNSLIFLTILLSMFFGFKNQVRAESSYDLKAESLIMNSAKCEINQPCSFTALVKNLGSDFTLNFPLISSVSADGYKTDSSTSISPARNTVIKTNDYITFTIYGIFTKIGSINLNFTVDSSGFLIESNTSNNSISVAVEVAGYDLAVEAINIFPASPMVNQNCLIQVKVKNNSSYNLYTENGLDFTRSLPDFSIARASSTSPSLNNLVHSGGYLYWEYEGSFTLSGEKQLSFKIDPEDVLAESNSANNLAVKKINVYNAADTDLSVDSIVFSANKIIVSTPFDLTVNIKNTGKTFLTDARGLSKAELSFNLPYFDYDINYPLVDAYPTISAPFKPADVFHYKFHGIFGKPGNFNLILTINKDSQLIESTLNNNATTSLVTVYKSSAEADDFTVLSKNVSLVSSTTAIINWQTSLKTTGVLNYNQAHYNVNDNTVNVTDNAIDHAVTLNKLQSGANYIYAITAKNGTAEKTEMISSFSLPGGDALNVVSGPNLSVSDKNAIVSWSTNLISSGRVYYKKKDVSNFSLAGADTLTAEHKVEIKNLADGVYDYFLSSTSTPKTNFISGWANFEIKGTPSALDVIATATATTSNNNVAAFVTTSFPINNNYLYEKLKGKIILRVQNKGEAYYLSPREKKMYYLGRPADAFQVIRSQGVGITNADLGKIPVDLSALSGADSDNDGLPDAFEEAIGTAQDKADTDGDGFDDRAELASGFSPLAKAKQINYDQAFANRQKGKILLQVQNRGQAWYINPADGKRYFLARPADAFNLMRQLGVGVTNGDYTALGGK